MRDKTTIQVHICTVKRPCKRFRACATCAARRQAYLADLTEHMATMFGSLTWAILHPIDTSESALKAAKKQFLKKTAPQAAIWTIERGTKKGNLHCNIITPTGSHYEPVKSKLWQLPISGNPRHVGAYIGKRSQMPPIEQYTGNLMGKTGHIWDYITDNSQPTTVLAAATEVELEGGTLKIMATDINLLIRPDYSLLQHKTMTDYHAIANRHLPELHRYKNQTALRGQRPTD